MTNCLVSLKHIVYPEQIGNSYTSLLTLENHIEKIFVESNRTKSLINKNVLFNIATLALSLGASTAGIAYFNIALDAAGDNKLLGYCFATATLVSYGGTAIWVSHEWLGKFFRAETSEQILLEDEPWYRHFSANALAIFSSIPLAYGVYKFNNNNIKLGILGYCSAFGFEATGFYEILNKSSVLGKTLTYFSGGNYERTVMLRKHKITSTILFLILPAVINNPKKLRELFTDNTQDNFVFFDKLVQLNRQLREKKIVPSNEWLCGMPRLGITILFCAFPIGNAVTSTIFAWEFASSLFDNIVLKILFPLLTVTPNFTLNIIAAKSVAEQLFDGFYNLLQHRNLGSTAFKVSPIFAVVCAFVSLVFSGFSAAVDAYITHETLAEKLNSTFATILSFSDFMTSTIFEYFALTAISNTLLLLFYKKFGSMEQKEFLRHIDCLKTASELIETAKPEKFVLLDTKYKFYEKISRFGTFYTKTNIESSILTEGSSDNNDEEAIDAQAPSLVRNPSRPRIPCLPARCQIM